MGKICLVRHGQTDWNLNFIIQGREDIPLNESGRQQAKDSAAFLKNYKWDVIISSPLIRAVETAEHIAKECEHEQILLDERFVERHFGEASGKSVPEFRAQIAIGEVAGMECDEELVTRCASAFHDVALKHKGKNVLIVAHSHAIKAVLHHLHPEEIGFHSPMANACANFLEKHESGQWFVKQYNVHEHITIK